VANTAVGLNSLSSNTTGSANNAFGSGALYGNTTGTDNVAMGANSVVTNTTGANNVGIGRDALYSNTTGNSNVVMGYSAGYSNTTGTNNTLIGRDAGNQSQTADGNVFIGEYAGRNTTNSNNTFLGTSSGWQVTSGQKNTILGRYNGNQGGIDIRTASNNIVLSDGDGNVRQQVVGNGNIGFGNFNAVGDIATSILLSATGNGTHANHQYRFGPHYTSDNPAFYVINENSTGVYLAHGGQSWNAHSDERIKENITSLGTVLPNIENLRCVKYNLKGQTDTKIGFIAQDWETNFLEVVNENSRQVIEDDGTISMDTDSESTTAVKAMAYTETIPVLLKAIQELSTKNDALEARIATLEG